MQAEEEDAEVKKYVVRPAKNLKSSFLKRMEDRQREKDEAVQRKLQEEEAQRQAVSMGTNQVFKIRANPRLKHSC